jgi:hypothetical protein
MTRVVTAEQARPLVAIATTIRNDIEAADRHWQSAVEHARRAGEGLIEAKGMLKHGEWLPWLEANFPGFSERSAQNYMRMARNRNAVADLPTIREAVAALAAPKPQGEANERLSPLEEFIRAGVVFGPTGLELPDGLPFEVRERLGVFLGGVAPKGDA